MKSTLTSADPSGWYECSLLNDSSGFRAIIWDGKQMLLGTNRILGPYANFRRLFTESDVAALREELTALRDEVKRLKSQPYELRRADKPDCVGVWMDNCGGVDKYDSDELEEMEPDWSPYYYMGPLPEVPVVVEQQPTKVVKVRNRKDAEVCQAIFSPCFSTLAIINDDGSFRATEFSHNWEEVQS